ncbi:EAL domain-containing protein (putative c-di-GMP-specific phosphodiesterase class I)/ABC-type amino acid transport substrate-binding protein [Methylohalomonas lacus]|uniref:EAL domain-containing protein (Putative c-di-GMP-specific phosphodiesterase class I)/ABC-type amino acid transport substrate-binding protein n=1 Tax=Methylohalomonas lacus TaxID=398773 RepID=A0AAE3L4M4_9GAMM|nr:EAL domain-containing protein [Methylohalomonas lacus]MCS3904103.1 EAL domain-containing protein (putative c-di-GMP-specific phosphodiesterase class I)/ABC-type amino acid transport substrate-binding protein [Methylohalomonas lacus]
MILRVAVATGLWLLSAIVMAGQADSPDADGPVVFQGATYYAPFYAIDSETGDYAGFDIALFEAIAGTAGFEVAYRFDDWDTVQHNLTTGRVDVVPMFVSPERAERYSFTDPILIENHLLFGYQDAASHRNLKSLAGYRIAAEGGAYALQELQRRNIDATLIKTNSEAEALQRVVRGEADYALVPTHIGYYSLEKQGLHQLSALSPPVLPVAYAYAVHPGQPELLEAINAALIQLQRQGVRRELQEQWLAPYDPENVYESGSYWWLIGVGLLVVALVIAIGWYRYRTWQPAAPPASAPAADTEPVTGLLQKAPFMAQVQAQLAGRTSRDGALILVAIDDYAYLQHIADDETNRALLQRTAERLQRILPGPIGYLDLNQFAGLVDSDHETVIRRIGAINDLVVEVYGQRLPVELTMGVALLSGTADDITETLRRARLALHDALQQRVPCQRYAAALEPDVEDLALVNDLKQALTARQLTWYFQAQFSLDEQRVTGAEMLIRWQHPRRGWISPERFIRLAEQHRLINIITRQLIGKAEQVLRHWRELHYDGRLSINVSARDLADDAIIEMLVETFKPFTGLLTIEITETALMQDIETIAANLRRLSAAGIRISLDDYGTGYSSLNYLKLFPINEIKIDRDFIRHLETSDRDNKLTQASIQLAHELNALIVAEGVESQPIMDRLMELGCDVVQGYGIARPLPESEFLEFARKDRN